MEVHKIDLAMNYVLGCSRVYNLLGIIVSNKCLGEHIIFRGNYERRYLSWLMTIPSVGFLIFIVYSTSYVLFFSSISLVLFPSGNATLRVKGSRGNEYN